MAFARIQHNGGAVSTTLSGSITSGATSAGLTASTGWPDGATGPFYAVIDAGLATEEKVLITSRTSLTLNTITRGVDNTSASAHASGATISHCFTAVEADEANQAVTKTLGLVTTKGDGIFATGSQALARVAAGANNTVLHANSGAAAGVSYSAIVAADITTGTITSNEIADGTITGTDIASETVTSTNILDGTIATADIADSAVTSAKIADGTIATADIAALAITTALLNAAAVTQPKLDPTLVSSDDLVAGSPGGDIDVTSATFADYGISGSSTVPSWATKAIVRTCISGTSVTTTSTSRFRTQIGTALGSEHVVQTLGATGNENVGYADKITLSGTGSQTVKLQARRGSGTGAYRMQGTLDRMSFDITYLP